MTAQEGQGADDQRHQNPPSTESDAEQPGRKVAKTIVEGALPQIPDASQSSPASEEQTKGQEPKRVAKTMLELNRPSADEIIAASSAAAQEKPTDRKVAKTMLDISRPEPDQTAAVAVDSTENENADTKRVPKTMLEINRPDISASTPTDATTAPAVQSQSHKQPAPKKTMLEMSLPAQSDTLKHVKKVSKTMLDVNSLDAIGMAKALKQEQQKEPVPVKVRKTLTSERAIPNLNESLHPTTTDDTKTVVSAGANSNRPNPETQADKPSSSTRNQKKRTRGTERFVAKTILDHSVLSEQLVKSHEKEKMKAAYIAQERTQEPVREFHAVDSKKLASPCAWTWSESNSSKGRVRACEKCQTKVYDLSGMEMPEAEALIFKHESKNKFSLYKRSDGKFMTSDCPVQAQRKRNLILLCLTGALIIICVLAFMLMMPPPTHAPDMVQGSERNNGHTSSQSTGEPGSSNQAGADAGAKTTMPSTTSSDRSSGKVHFEAGRADLQEAPNPGLFPTVKATPDASEAKNNGGTDSSSIPANSTSGQNGAVNSTSGHSIPNTTSSTGDSSNKYWDDGK